MRAAPHPFRKAARRKKAMIKFLRRNILVESGLSVRKAARINAPTKKTYPSEPIIRQILGPHFLTTGTATNAAIPIVRYSSASVWNPRLWKPLSLRIFTASAYETLKAVNSKKKPPLSTSSRSKFSYIFNYYKR